MFFIKSSIFFLIIFNSLLSSQTLWQKHPSNPVLQTGSPGIWDANSVYAPSVIFDGAGYKMYYAGYNGFNYQIGLATSDDKINWTRHASVPVLDYGIPGSWDSRYVSQPTVIFENGIYKMWYTGWAGGGMETFKIGYAISVNGTNWDKYDFNPVLSASTVGNWDPIGISSPSVVYSNDLYHMWFSGDDGLTRAIGYATSADGISWNWYQGNPVLEGSIGEWDNDVAHCEVLYIGGNFIMYYTGFESDTARIGYARSVNGILWEKYKGNPILSIEQNSWEQLAVDEPDAFFDGSCLYMWYSGFEEIEQSQIGYAVEITINVNENENTGLAEFRLSQNYPNPFNPSTKIKFTVPQSPLPGGDGRGGLVTLKVYDILGNEIATLVDGAKSPGVYEVEFDGTGFQSGVYYYQLRVANFVAARKMIYLK